MFTPQPTMNAVALEIVEQPKQRGMRFRYECEGRSAGSIPGENTTADKKTWPTCQIVNYFSAAIMRVSLVSINDPPRPHPHSLVGRDCSNGICQINIDPANQMQGVFPNLGIQCVRRKEVSSSISERLRNGVNPFNTPIDSDEHSAVDVDLNIVRLCFEAFLPDERGHYTRKLNPVVSNPIYDKKATSSSVLKICRVDKMHGTSLGNDEIFLLCDKVQKEDIQVVFSHDGWENIGDFSPADVHRQVAIVFKTPPYRDETIRESVEVEFRLRRPSDMETSSPLVFTYLPIQHDPPRKLPFPSGMHPRFGRTDVKAETVRTAIKERAKKFPVSRLRPDQRKRPLPQAPQFSFSSQAPSFHPTRPSMDFSASFQTSSAPWPSSGRNIFTDDLPGPSGLNMPLKQETPFSTSFQTGPSWGNQTPFPSSQAQPAPPLSQSNFPEMLDFTSTATDITANLPESSLLTDILKLDSFPSIGPEATSQVLGNTTAIFNEFSKHETNFPTDDCLDALMEKKCSIEERPPPSTSQHLEHQQDMTLMGTGATEHPMALQNADFLPAQSPHTFTIMSPNHAMSPQTHHAPPNIMSRQQQQYATTTMRYQSEMSAFSPIQQVTFPHQQVTSPHQQVASPHQQVTSPHGMVHPGTNDLNLQHDFQFQNAHNYPYDGSNMNNSNNHLAANTAQDNQEDSLEKLIRSYSDTS